MDDNLLASFIHRTLSNETTFYIFKGPQSTLTDIAPSIKSKTVQYKRFFNQNSGTVSSCKQNGATPHSCGLQEQGPRILNATCSD